MILNTNISWDYREFSSTNLGYLVDNCSGLLTNIWAFTVCFPVEMVDTGLGHTPLESQFSGDGSSELQRAFYKEEREEEWDSEQEGSMLKGSRLPRGCVFWGVLFFGSLPLWKHCSWPYYLPLPSLTHKGMPIAITAVSTMIWNRGSQHLPLSVLKRHSRLTCNFSHALPDWMWSDPWSDFCFRPINYLLIEK